MKTVSDEASAYRKLRQEQHSYCIVCGRSTGIEFRCRDGLVEAEFTCRRFLEGYAGVLHGGVVCAVLDGAMTNCLFAAGRSAVTGDLQVRFRKPVIAEGTAVVQAWIEKSAPPLYKVAAHIRQDGEIKAIAQARFMEGGPLSEGSQSTAPNPQSSRGVHSRRS